MRESYIRDKNTNIAFVSIFPNNDINCKPFDYYRSGYALLKARTLKECVSVYMPELPITDEHVYEFALKKVDENIKDLLDGYTEKSELKRLLICEDIDYKQQNELLKNMVLLPKDILWFNKMAQELDYLLDVYQVEILPDKFKAKKQPVCYYIEDDGRITVVGDTDMTEGEMRALIEQRKVLQVRIYHKGNKWHCFYFTYRGLDGKERGQMGAKPHYHYLSDKSGIKWDYLLEKIKAGDMPTSQVHIIIDRNS